MIKRDVFVYNKGKFTELEITMAYLIHPNMNSILSLKLEEI